MATGIYNGDKESQMTFADMVEGSLYQITEDHGYLGEVVIIANGVIVNISTLEVGRVWTHPSANVGVKRVPTGSSITITQDAP